MRWLLGEGETVSTHSVLFELETDKAIIEVPSPADGVLLKILSPFGPAKVEAVVGWIGAPGERLDYKATKERLDGGDCRQPVAHGGRPEARISTPSTPAARRRAGELGVELSTLTGSGPNGRITQEDVERAAVTKAGPQRPDERGRGELMRNLTHAWQTVPHIHISRQLDGDALAALSNRIRGLHISVTDLLLFALSRLLPAFPELTRTWQDERLEPASGIHIAFAVDTGNSVVAPVIRNISSLRAEQISQRRRELTDMAREQRMKLADLQDGVFTLSNLGMSGADFFAPIVAWPQTAMLAVGRLAQEPVARNGSIEVGWRMWANIALDHRAVDGVLGARFLAALQDSLNQLPKDF